MKLEAPQRANRSKKCLGRGRGCGHGKTSGRGHKGQKSRSGGSTRLGFEGGQMPLYRRVAVRGFSNWPFKKEYVPVNIRMLSVFYEDGETVSRETLIEKGIVKKSEARIKILGSGELTKKLTVQIPHISAGAKEKIVAAGGTVAEPASSGTDTGEKS